jgi:hypothetical protein
MQAAPSSSFLLNTAQPDQIVRFREVMDAQGYTDRNVIATLGSMEVPSRRTRNIARLLHSTAGGRPLDTLIRMFLFGSPVEREAASTALAPLPLNDVIDLGLVEDHGQLVRGSVTLLPYENLLLAFDHPSKAESGAHSDLVMGLASSSMDTIHFMVRRPSRRTLDLGTGCGVIAFLASGHSEEVIGVDRNPRAVNFSVFNAHLNGMSKVRFVEGNAFEPVRGLRFDQILANPPFVVGPSLRYLYRDNGMKADLFAQKLVREAPEVLEEGGFCQLICEWVHLTGQDWKERLAGWFAGNGCDVWVIKLDTDQPRLYADRWINNTEDEDPVVSARLYEEWMNYYREEGIEAISTGLIAMRKRSGGNNWLRIDDSTEKTYSEPFGDFVLQSFAAKDFLERMKNDADLLEQKLKPSPDLRLMQQCKWAPGHWDVLAIQLGLAHGMKYVGNVDRYVANLIAHCDGEHTLRELLSDMARGLGVEFEKVTGPCLGILRQLIERGFVRPEVL